MRSNLSRWSLVFLLSLLPVFAHAQFAGGSGTATDPWLIATAEQLDAIRNHSTNHFRLIADINLGVAPWNEGEGWLPIAGFQGSVDGANHGISNLFINRPAASPCGLFSSFAGDPFAPPALRVVNLRLEEVDILGASNTGALAGSANAAFRNVHVSGRIEGQENVGGLFGLLSGSLQDASADVEVTGSIGVGAVVGQASAFSSFIECSMARIASSGIVRGVSLVGGLAGYVSEFVLLVDSYSLASVFGESDWVGGFVGRSEGDLYACYSAGAVTSETDSPGGFCGYSTSPGRMLECYWDLEASGQPTSSGGEGRTTAEMQKQSAFPWFNFSLIWDIDEDEGYPTLREVAGTSSPAPVDLADLAGEGTEEDPYILTNVHELHVMGQGWFSFLHFRLGNDIDCAPAISWNNGKGWTPIGGVSGAFFSGTLDGAGFAISNLVIRNPRRNRVGLFGEVRNAQLQRLRLVQADVLGGSACGALVGELDTQVIWPGTVMDQIHVEGNVFSIGSDVGGVIGLGLSRLHDISFNGNVRGVNGVGGLVGNAQNPWAQFAGLRRILHAAARGGVQGEDHVGGLVGQATPGLMIQDSYSRASVTGHDYVGGLVGRSRNATFYRCYSAAPVRGSGGRVGGLEGDFDDEDPLERPSFNSYWDVEASGQTEGRKGLGRTTAEMVRRSTYEHWNFVSLWQIEEGEGYPEFRDLGVYELPIDLELDDLQGVGTVEDPYIITNVHELNAVRKGLDRHYRLGNDIEMSDTLVWNHGNGWLPIGAVSGNPFTGTFDGAGFALLNSMSTPFFQVAGGTLKNLNMLGMNHFEVSGDHAGGLCAILTATGAGVPGQIHSVVLEGAIFGRRQPRALGALHPSLVRSGGVVGRMMGNSLVSNAVANVTIYGGDISGGIVGQMFGGRLRNVCSLALIESAHWAGGLCGDGWGSISNSYSRSHVIGIYRAGGLAGAFQSGEIGHSFAAGSVSADQVVGGVVGVMGIDPISIDGVYWDVERSGQTIGPLGEPRTTAEMTFPYDPDTFENWDFVSVWTADTDGRNNGYPYLAGLQIPTVTLSYEAGLGGSLIGPTTQTILAGADGVPVTTDPEPGAQFGRWSDGQGGAVRQDLGVGQDLSVMAFFKSEGGVDIDWYAGKGFFPGAGQTWADLDGLDPLNKGMTLLQDFVADTDPHDSSSLFEIHSLDWTVGPRLHFRSSAARRYRLESRADLDDGEWLPVPGAGPRRGVGGQDTMTDMNALGGAVNYRLSVEVP